MAEVGVALPDTMETFVCIKSPSGLGELPLSHCPTLFSADICVPETRPSWAPTFPLAGICMSFSAVTAQQQFKALPYRFVHGGAHLSVLR